MANRLSLEIWAQIAGYLENDVDSFPKYARICRHAQSAFEPRIYSTVSVRSEDFEVRRGIMTLAQFNDLTFGTAASGRALIRWLNYTIVIPYELEDYRAVKLENETYSEENPIREENNLAFRASIVSLFQILSSWGEEYRAITLTINVIGRQQVLEPGTREGENLMQLESVPNGEQWVVSPYRARFPQDDASMLPRIFCVEELIYEEYFNFWPGAALQVAAHCDSLSCLRLFVEEPVRPDHLRYLRSRHQAIASALATLPTSIKAFDLWGYQDTPCANFFPSGSTGDELSLNLRGLSLNLRELEVSYTPVALDFLFPLDENASPTPKASSLHWPYLEAIRMDAMHNFLPNGEWLGDRSPRLFEEEENLSGWQLSRDKLHHEKFHRLFISLGLAARRMPRICEIRFVIREYSEIDFEFWNAGGYDEKLSMRMRNAGGYKPDKRVAEAWGFALEDLEVSHNTEDNDGIHFVEADATWSRLPPDP